jgi:hypothetical protein
MTVGTRLLTSLPPEILLIISEHMEAYDLVRLSRTCRALSHFGGWKYVAKAFTRHKTADKAIRSLQYTVNRMDLVIELFRHVKDQAQCYTGVAFIAARLNDIKQLEAWRAEFGFIPNYALYGAASSNRTETFDFVFQHVKIDYDNAEFFFATIGEEGNRTLLDHLKKKNPDLVTPVHLESVVQGSALHGHFDFALDVFEEMSPRCGKVIHDCAGHIAVGAAANGNTALFSEFIDKFQYCDEIRNAIASTAASNGHVELMRAQEETENPADSFENALLYAVENNSVEAVQFILGDDYFVTNRLSSFDLVQAFRWAISDQRKEMLPLLSARVPRIYLLREAAKAASIDEAKVFLGGYGNTEKLRAIAEYSDIEFGVYSDDVPDWKMTIWLVIIGIDADARIEKSDIDDAERTRYLSVLPAAIDLARELDVDEAIIVEMARFANRTLE